MTTGRDETTSVLLTAGLVAIAVGALLASFPAGLTLGLIVALAGIALFVVVAVRAWRAWRRRPKREQPRQRDPERFWIAKPRLESLIASSAVMAVGTVVVSVMNPADERWGLLWLFGPLLVGSVVAFLLVRRHDRRKNRAPESRDE